MVAVPMDAGRATVELLSADQAASVDGSRSVVASQARSASPSRSTARGDGRPTVAAGAERLGRPVVTPWQHRNARVATRRPRPASTVLPGVD
jgi:hypothetical protein